MCQGCPLPTGKRGFAPVSRAYTEPHRHPAVSAGDYPHHSEFAYHSATADTHMGLRKRSGGVTIILEATVVRLLIGRHPLITLAEKQASSDGHYLVSARVPEVRATLEGLEGDRHAGFTRLADARVPQYPRGTEIHNSRQVSLVAEEELAEIAANMGVPVIEPEWIGANLVLRGVPHLSRLPPMTRVYFPELAALALEGENHPCLFPGKAIQHAYPGYRGSASSSPKRPTICAASLAGWSAPG